MLGGCVYVLCVYCMSVLYAYMCLYVHVLFLCTYVCVHCVGVGAQQQLYM